MILRTYEAVRCADADAVVAHLTPGRDVIVPIANGEPATLLDAVERSAARLAEVRVHQMHALRDRPYLHGRFGSSLRHVAYFLSPITRDAFAEGGCDFVPANFSEVPALLRETTKDPIVVASASPMDRHGFFSLGPCADYAASFIGNAPFFLEVNQQVPRTFGRNLIHISEVVGLVEADYPLVEVPARTPSDLDRRIAAHVAERIPNGSTLQVGIGSIPNAVMDLLRDHQHLGVHTELVSDGLMELVDAGVLTGTRKTLNPGKIVATFALGTAKLYEFIDQNGGVEFWPVDYVNDPRTIGREDNFVSINATLDVDLVGQCASETLHGVYYSGSGGQADFARGAMYSRRGQGFVVLHSTTADGQTSRITPQLCPGSVVTTPKNTVDKVVTEYGVAELRGRSLRERAQALIAISHPRFRDWLTREAKQMGYLT